MTARRGSRSRRPGRTTLRPLRGSRPRGWPRGKRGRRRAPAGAYAPHRGGGRAGRHRGARGSRPRSRRCRWAPANRSKGPSRGRDPPRRSHAPQTLRPAPRSRSRGTAPSRRECAGRARPLLRRPMARNPLSRATGMCHIPPAGEDARHSKRGSSRVSGSSFGMRHAGTPADGFPPSWSSPPAMAASWIPARAAMSVGSVRRRLRHYPRKRESISVHSTSRTAFRI